MTTDRAYPCHWGSLVIGWWSGWCTGWWSGWSSCGWRPR